MIGQLPEFDLMSLRLFFTPLCDIFRELLSPLLLIFFINDCSILNHVPFPPFNYKFSIFNS